MPNYMRRQPSMSETQVKRIGVAIARQGANRRGDSVNSACPQIVYYVKLFPVIVVDEIKRSRFKWILQ